MHRFQTTLVPGKKRPYTSWTFLIIPNELAKAWGAGQKAIRGTMSGTAFRGTASRGEGVLLDGSAPEQHRKAFGPARSPGRAVW